MKNQKLLVFTGGVLTAAYGTFIYRIADFVMPGSVLFLLLPFFLFFAGLTAGCLVPFPHGAGSRAFFSVFASACLFNVWLPLPKMDFCLRFFLTGFFAGLLTGKHFCHNEDKLELAAKCHLYANGLLYGTIPAMFGTETSILTAATVNILYALFSVIYEFRQAAKTGKRIRYGWSLCGILLLTVLCAASCFIQIRNRCTLFSSQDSPEWDPQVCLIEDFLMKHTPGEKISVLLVKPGQGDFYRVFSLDERVGKTNFKVDWTLMKENTDRYDLIVINLPGREYARLNGPFLEYFKDHLTENGKVAVTADLIRKMPELRSVIFKIMNEVFPSVLAPEQIPVLIAGRDFSRVRPPEDNPVFYEVAENWLKIQRGTARTAAEAEALGPYRETPSSLDKLLLKKCAGNTPEKRVFFRYAQKLREYALPVLLGLLGIYLVFRYLRAYQPSAVLLNYVRELTFGMVLIFMMLVCGDAIRFKTDHIGIVLLHATIAFVLGFLYAPSRCSTPSAPSAPSAPSTSSAPSTPSAQGKWPFVFTGLLILLSGAAYRLTNIMQFWSFCATFLTALLTGFVGGGLFYAILQNAPDGTVPGKKIIFNIFFSFTAAIFLYGFLLQDTQISCFVWILSALAVFFATPVSKKG